MSTTLAELMEPVARRLLGEPNEQLSKKDELRYGAKGSLSVNLKKGTFYDHENNEGGGVLDLIRREHDSDPLEWLRKEGLIKSDTIVATFDYRGREGRAAVSGLPHRRQRVQTATTNGGDWIWKLEGVRRVPYRLPELIADTGTVFIPEGEKHVDALRALGLRATCNSGGAGKWRPEYGEFLRGADVVVMPDNDAPGQKHAQTIALKLHGNASRVRVLALPDLRPKGDVINWLTAGGTVEELLRLAAQVPEWHPPDDRADPHPDLGQKSARQSEKKILLEITEDAELFRSPDGTAVADLDVNGHRETWPIRSKTFRLLLARRYYEKTGGAPSSEARQAAINVIEAQAMFGKVERRVWARVGGLDGKIYLDLADTSWRAVEVDANGWRVINDPPVRFRRSAGMLPLPLPVRGGSVGGLRRSLNVGSDADFTLVVAWLLAALRDRGPYPVAVVAGEQGSAKSTFAAMTRRLIDPNTAPLRALPREDRDLFIAATNAHVLAFDNVSGLPPWMSDTLCRLASGGGFATRELYADRDEVLFDAARPIILNGIEDVVTRPDLADRAIMLTLAPIPDDQRRAERDMQAEFDVAHPAVLGALLDAVSHGLRTLPHMKLKQLPRMADFAMWISACEGALDLPCTFEAAYRGNLAAAVETVIEADPVAVAVRALMASTTEWKGTATLLLSVLGNRAGETVRHSKHWPGASHVLSRRLRRAATFLRKTGIDVDLGDREGHASNKIIRITTGLPLGPTDAEEEMPPGPSDGDEDTPF
jgi:hypothetical protein